MRTVLIQPGFSGLEEYVSYAREEGLQTEIMDLSFPYVLENPKQKNKMLTAYRKINPYSMHGVFMDINIASNDHEIKSVSRERSAENFRMAQELGCKHLVFHTNFLPVMNDKDYLERWCESNIEFYTPLCETFQMTVYLENTLDLFPDALAMLMEKTRHNPRIQVCLDIGHLNLSKAPMEDWFATLAPSVGYLHYSDNTGRFDDHMAIGDGNINWHKCHELILKHQISAPVTLEVGNLSQIKKSIQYLKKNKLYPYQEGKDF